MCRRCMSNKVIKESATEYSFCDMSSPMIVGFGINPPHDFEANDYKDLSFELALRVNDLYWKLVDIQRVIDGKIF